MAYEFVNPYNFFPLSDHKQVVENDFGEKCSGVIKYRIISKTPLFIPDTTKAFIEKTEDDKDHPHNVFISLNDLSCYKGEKSELDTGEEITKPASPYIPGSEVRGLIRSVYEMLTDSCLSTLNDDDILSKRTHEVFSAGLLKKIGEGKFELYKAHDCLFRAKETGSTEDAPGTAYRHKLGGNNKKMYDKNGNAIYEYSDYGCKSYKLSEFKEGEKVFIQKTDRGGGCKPIAKKLSKECADGSTTEGYMMKGLDGPVMESNKKGKKHNCHIFVLDETKNGGKVECSLNLSILETVLGVYEKNGDNIYKEYKDQYEEFKKKSAAGAFFPVYYSIIPKINTAFLSPAAITREIYSRRIKDAVHGMNPCNGRDKLCPACRLFGTVKTEKAISSKLRFSDLSFVGCNGDNNPKYTGAKTLIPLSAPKISNMEFYLQRPADNAVFWTYDYYIDYSENIRPNKSGINGRKFYWNYCGEVLTTKEKSDQNKTVYPLDAGNVFCGQLYFNGITNAELENLIYIMNCSDVSGKELKDRDRCYKLGAAKPAGLGSVAIKADSVIVREWKDNNYTTSPYKTTGNHNLSHLDDFAVMTGFAEEKVDYPRMAEDGKVFEWFSDNHKGYIIKDGKKKATKSPSKRTMEYFAKYMIPLQKKLEEIVIPGLTGAAGNGYCCLDCGGSVEVNTNTGKPFPLCTKCKNKKTSVECSGCGKSFDTPQYYAEKYDTHYCNECRDKNKK